ncbi:MAG: type IV pili methyl-accepting chemotaxis transducer N-terminal domain-containing protein [Planctomycetota bacterium]
MRIPITTLCVLGLASAASLFVLSTPHVASAGAPAGAMGDSTRAQWGVVLNLSGKQRMLTQKMSKEALLVALDVEKAGNLASLEKTAALFERTLTGLRDGDDGLGLPGTESRRILKQLGKVEAIWAEFQPAVAEVTASGTVTAEQVATIAVNNLPLLKEMNKCVKLYEKEAAKSGLKSDPDLAVTINLAGKQRMLTQKLSKELLLMALGHDVDGNKLNAIETSALFDQTLAGLIQGDETLGLPGTDDAATLAQLEKVTALWGESAPVVARATASGAGKLSASDIETLARVNLPLLKEMNAAVGMFAADAE